MKPFLKAVKSIASRFRLARRSTAASLSGLTLNNLLTAKPDILARFFQAVQQRVFTLCRPTQPRHRPRHLEKTHPGNEGARLYTKTGACAATAAGPAGRYIGAPTCATSVGAEAAGFPGRFPRRAVCTGARRCPAAGGRRNETTRWQCGCTRGGRRPLATRRPPPAIPTRLPTRLRATGLL